MSADSLKTVCRFLFDSDPVAYFLLRKCWQMELCQTQRLSLNINVLSTQRPLGCGCLSAEYEGVLKQTWNPDFCTVRTQMLLYTTWQSSTLNLSFVKYFLVEMYFSYCLIMFLSIFTAPCSEPGPEKGSHWWTGQLCLPKGRMLQSEKHSAVEKLNYTS